MDTIAILGLIVAGIAALASPVSSYFTTKAQLDNQRKLAAIERRQKRLETTYKRTVEYLLHQRDWAIGTEPEMTFGGEPRAPEPMDRDELRAREADVVLHGSPQVLAKMNSIVGLANKFGAAAWLMAAQREHPPRGPGAADEMRKAFDDLRSSRKALRDEIEATTMLINAELREE